MSLWLEINNVDGTKLSKFENGFTEVKANDGNMKISIDEAIVLAKGSMREKNRGFVLRIADSKNGIFFDQ